MNTSTFEWALIGGLLMFLFAASTQLLRYAHSLRLAKASEVQWLERASRTLTEIREKNADAPSHLIKAISRVTGLDTWFLHKEEEVFTEAHLEKVPFFVDPYLATMAVRTRKTVQQRQLTQWGGAFAYIPVFKDAGVLGLVVLSGTSEQRSADQAFDVLLAEYMCISWNGTSLS